MLEECGYAPVGYFVLPATCWLENYHGPLDASLEGFLARHGHSEAARSVVDAEREEIALYKQYGSQYSYGFYIARRAARRQA